MAFSRDLIQGKFGRLDARNDIRREKKDEIEIDIVCRAEFFGD